jgi:hypothetical protein
MTVVLKDVMGRNEASIANFKGEQAWCRIDPSFVRMTGKWDAA